MREYGQWVGRNSLLSGEPFPRILSTHRCLSLIVVLFSCIDGDPMDILFELHRVHLKHLRQLHFAPSNISDGTLSEVRFLGASLFYFTSKNPGFFLKEYATLRESSFVFCKRITAPNFSRQSSPLKKGTSDEKLVSLLAKTDYSRHKRVSTPQSATLLSYRNLLWNPSTGPFMTKKSQTPSRIDQGSPGNCAAWIWTAVLQKT